MNSRTLKPRLLDESDSYERTGPFLSAQRVALPPIFTQVPETGQPTGRPEKCASDHKGLPHHPILKAAAPKHTQVASFSRPMKDQPHGNTGGTIKGVQARAEE